MKIRNGFVSNSSSSSFCIVGVMNTTWEDGINLSEQNEDEFERMKNQVKELSGYGYACIDGDIKVICNYDDDIDYIGIDCSKMFEDGKTFNDVKSEFLKQMKELYKMEIPEKLVHIFYGESSSE